MSHRVVVTAGHVDHGKSTLLRALTGMEPDRLDEERRRGLSLDLGFVWTTLTADAAHAADATDATDATDTVNAAGTGGAGGAGDTGGTGDTGGAATSGPAPTGPDDDPLTVAFVDVPGHERFVGTMLAGAGTAPTALLVVAADDGWSAQSQEHLEILDLLDVTGLAVAITKTSLVPADRVAAVAADVTERLAGTALDGTPVVAVDGVTGEGLDRLRRLLDHRLRRAPAPPDIDRPRLWIDRCFTVAGAGTVVTGTLREGALRRGDDVTVPTRGLRGRIRGLQSLGRDVDRAPAGTRVAANLGGIDHALVGRGDVVVDGGPWRTTREVDVLLRVLPRHRVDRRGAWHVHVGTARTTAQVLPLVGAVEGRGVVRLRLAWPLPLVVGDRLVLREAGRRATVAGGTVVDPAPGPRPVGTAARRARAAALADVPDLPRERWAAALLAAEGRTAEAAGDRAARGAGARDAESLQAAVGRPAAAGDPPGVLRVGPALVHPQAARRWARAVLDAAGRETGASPAPVAREALTGAAEAAGAPASLAPAVVDLLVQRDRLRRTGGGYVPAERAAAAVDASRARRDRVVARLAAEPFAPPDLDAVAREEGCSHREVAALVQSGEVVRLGKVAFAASAIEEAVARLERLAPGDRAFTAAEAKRAWGTTRRFAIPLLEHLDARGITVFDGQHRTLRRH